MNARENSGINRRTLFSVTESLTLRFWRRVEKKSDDECWPWTGALRNGYGAIKNEKKTLSAHVVSAVIHHGQIPNGMIVLHTCDNRLCCNPSHIRFGTPQQNVREMHERRVLHAPRGSEVPNAKLNDEIVLLFRAFKAAEGVGARRLSRMFDFPYGCIDGALDGKTWKHVKTPTAEEAKDILRQWRLSNVEFASGVQNFQQPQATEC